MDRASALELIRRQHRAVLATERTDGSPQLTPVVVAVDRDDQVVISTRETAMKTKNVRRNPRAWLCVLPDSFFGQFVQVDGPVTVLGLPDAMDALIEYYRTLNGEHPNWDEYREAMRRERRVLLRIDVQHAGPDRSG